MKIIGNLRNKIRLHNAKKFIHIDKNLPEAEKKIIKDNILPLVKFAKGENMKLLFSRGEDLFQSQTVMKVKKQESLLSKTVDNEYFIHWIWRNIGEAFVDLKSAKSNKPLSDQLIDIINSIKTNFYKQTK